MKKKILYGVILSLVLVVGCTAQSKADTDSATYIESVDEYNTFISIKLVDKETGCKYLITNTEGEKPSTIQMLGKDGLPVCE